MGTRSTNKTGRLSNLSGLLIDAYDSERSEKAMR